MIDLYPHQQDLIAAARTSMLEGRRRILLQLPTGGGKTVIAAHMLGTAARRGKRAWFIVHRRELVRQSCSTFARVGIPHGVVAAGFPGNRHEPVQVCSIQTLARRMDLLQAPDFIVWDECHHLAAASWSEVSKAYPRAIQIGLSATPQRLDGRGLSEWFDAMLNGPSTAWLIDHGFLAPYRLYAPPAVDVSRVHTTGGDFNKGELAAALDASTITGDAIAHYRKLALGKRAVVFDYSIASSLRTVALARAAGIPAEHVDGETDAVTRDAAIQRFTRGETLLLSNVDLFGEGFDLPAIEVVILKRPTKSLAIYLQQVGRALRTSPGKAEALILDHAGNCARHGLPDDEREWTLDGRRKRRKAEADISIKHCPACQVVNLSTARTCKACGHVWVEAPAREIEHVDGELVEVDRIALQRAKKREQAAASTIEELEAIGRARGMKFPHLWAQHVMKARGMKHVRG